MAEEEKVKIDTHEYKHLYGHQDIKRHGRFRPLPDIEFKPEVKEVLRQIEENDDINEKQDKGNLHFG